MTKPEETAEAAVPVPDRREALTRSAAGLLLAGTGALLATRAAVAADPGESVALGRRWIDALNRRDVDALGAVLTDDFIYTPKLRNPPEMAPPWTKEKFLGITKSTADAGWKKPVVMKIVSEFGTGDRAVIEAEGYSELSDGYVYANVYCFNFWTEGGKIKAIHDYCCTHTAWLLTQHMRELAKKTKAS
jgi:ketosteroid isomerase-like protein